eukprot:CAMPEP_0202725966 /NCGR_PEP_ID=MMETSP1385-20130828/184370_1 /ASSEMBLY_ACC=CAM_ASM_000861 /TAXON_ID=933848 /ORGANISM="Elphidium margaritaceum" /LENGTH=686 /DNA_ID=CAMNT_0049392171 /DNA_START=46 /DNA_END=2106 /DNA_ORIENTATION=+
MSCSPLQQQQQRKLVIETYNKIKNESVENPLELLQSRIDLLQSERCNVAELSLLYCLQSVHLFEGGFYDEAYKWAMHAYALDSERKEVLQMLIKIHIPGAQHQQNPYQHDEKAREYALKLEELCPEHIKSLCVAAECYSSLGLYNDALRVFKQAFFKSTSSNKQYKSHEYERSADVEEIKLAITKTYIDRYTNCPNDAHESIIQYLVELIEWKYHSLDVSKLQMCIEEIWERIEYILGKHFDTITDENLDVSNDRMQRIETQWNSIHKLLCFIPCSVPLSVKLLSLIYDIVYQHERFEFGVEFFSRLISEYQTYHDNCLTVFARFDNYHVLYLLRAKFYKLLAQTEEMMEDIDQVNTRNMLNEKASENGVAMVAVSVDNLLAFPVRCDQETPIIETMQQIKKRRASRISNINISPMPKQYRDLHLTPKTQSASKQPSSAAAAAVRDIVHRSSSLDTELKDAEETTVMKDIRGKCQRLQNENCLLQTRLVDLKNDMFRETQRNVQCKKELDSLQQQIKQFKAELADRESRSTVTETTGTTPNGEAGTSEMEEQYLEHLVLLKRDITKRDVLICELKMENEKYCATIGAQQREINILKDCKKQNVAPKDEARCDVKPAEPVVGKASAASSSAMGTVCQSFLQLVKFMIGLLALVVLVFVVNEMIQNDDDEITEGVSQNNVYDESNIEL